MCTTCCDCSRPSPNRHYDSAEQALESYRGRGAFADWPEAVLRDCLAGGLHPALGGKRVELCCSPAWESQCFQKSGVFARRRWLRGLACPVRILKPEHLSTMQVPSVERALRRRPETRIEIIPGGGHLFPMQDAEGAARIASDVLDFLPVLG